MQNYNLYNPYNNIYNPNGYNNQYAFVKGIESAKSFQMPPNQTMLLMDEDNPYCYMKTTNNLGQATLRFFKLKEVSESDLRIPAQVITEQPKEEYVSKTNYDELLKRVEALEKAGEHNG